MDCRSGRILKFPKQSSRRIESERRYQLAQLSGESPYASGISTLAPRLKKQLDRGFISKCGCAMERRFAFGSCIAHKSSGLYARFGDRVGVRSKR